MSKRKHTPEWMIDRVEEYLSGQRSVHEIATGNGIGKNTLRYWIKNMKNKGL